MKTFLPGVHKLIAVFEDPTGTHPNENAEFFCNMTIEETMTASFIGKITSWSYITRELKCDSIKDRTHGKDIPWVFRLSENQIQTTVTDEIDALMLQMGYSI